MTDVVDYSRLMSEDQVGTLALLREWRSNCLDPLLAAQSGRLVKSMGDGVLAEFPSVVNAVRCAMELQSPEHPKRLGVAKWQSLRFRTGIAIGDVIVDGDDIFGDGVNIAARLQNLARPGWIYFSESVYQNIKSVLQAQYQDLGTFRLKNITQSVHVYGVSFAEAESPLLARGSTERPGNKIILSVELFANLEESALNSSLCIGLSTDLVTELSRFQELAVRLSADRDATQMRPTEPLLPHKAAAHYLLTGNLREAGVGTRLTVQLRHVVTDEIVWAQRYELNHSEKTTAHDDVLARIVTEVGVTIGYHSLKRAQSCGPDDLQSQDYVRIAWHAYLASPITGLHAVLPILKTALRDNPDDPNLLGILSRVYYRAANIAIKGDIKGFETAMDAARLHGEKALSLDMSNVDGRIGLAWYHMWKRDFAKARHHFETAFSINRYDQKVFISRATALTYLGRPAEALSLVESTACDHPHQADMQTLISAEACFFLREFERAADLLDRLSIESKAESHGIAIAAYAAAGRIDVARQETNAYISRLAKSWSGAEPKRAELAEWELEHCYPLARLEDKELLRQYLSNAVMS